LGSGLIRQDRFEAPVRPCSQLYGICSGILDQGAGVLVVFDETPSDKTYEASLETIQSMGKVVDALYVKTKKLT